MGAFLRFFGISSDDDRVDEATGLTGKQKRLVQNTWAVIREDEVSFGVAVITAFFTTYPKYQQSFEPFKDIPITELPANESFQAHCASFITALNNVIDTLDDPGLMEASLISIAERLKKPGQTEEEFENLRAVIVEVLSYALGKEFTLEVAEAWDKTLAAAFAKIYQVLIN